MFTSVFGGGMSSRLFQEVRERRGLCYAIYFDAPCRHGDVRPPCGTDAADVTELIRSWSARSLPRPPTISEAEMARAKAQLKAGLLMGLESSCARAEQMARQMFAWGRPMPLDELVASARAVTVRARARRAAP